jgi:hypothetical protein
LERALEAAKIDNEYHCNNSKQYGVNPWMVKNKGMVCALAGDINFSNNSKFKWSGPYVKGEST